MVVASKQGKANVSIKLMDSLAPAQGEVEAGVMAKADQKSDNLSWVECLTSFLKFQWVKRYFKRRKWFYIFYGYKSIVWQTDISRSTGS